MSSFTRESSSTPSCRVLKGIRTLPIQSMLHGSEPRPTFFGFSYGARSEREAFARLISTLPARSRNTSSPACSYSKRRSSKTVALELRRSRAPAAPRLASGQGEQKQESPAGRRVRSDRGHEQITTVNVLAPDQIECFFSKRCR